MKKSYSELPADLADVLDLGSVLGQNQAYGLVAGRCSAAQAASLQRMRDEKKFKRITSHWRDFCSRYLGISGAQADQIIQLWQEFGEGYFEVAQLTRISAETYRAISPSIRDSTLHVNGEAIELSPGNSRRVASAVAQLRRSAPSAKRNRQMHMHERLKELDKRCLSLVAEFAAISCAERCGENWLTFTGILSRTSDALRRLGFENGLS
jgi:hypothetical protein